MSNEHIVTEKIWSGDEIAVKGLPWCTTEHRFIPRQAYTANILCTNHNSSLSPVDQSGIHAFDVLRKTWQYHLQRVQLVESGQWSGLFDLIEGTIDGSGLEKWFLKTMINMEVVGTQGYPIGPYPALPNEPSREIVEIAFGLRAFEDKAGLRFIANESQQVDPQERIRYASFIRDADGGSFVAAAAFLFFGFRFFLCLESSGVPEAVLVGGNNTG